jgi:hypothetical protein
LASTDLGPDLELKDPVWARTGERLTATTDAVSELEPEAVEGMLHLFRTYFLLDDPAVFVRDLRSKDEVIRIWDPRGDLQGFSTVSSFPTTFQGREMGIVYSGDTIIAPDHWGTSVLPRTWLDTVIRMSETLPRPLYWLLLSSGHKTYRLLTLFFREFYPSVEKGTPARIQAFMDQLGRERFGEQYLEESGVVRFTRGATPLREGVSPLGCRELESRHTTYFLSRNPGYVSGDELVCLAEVADDNLTRAARRILRALGRERLS